MPCDLQWDQLSSYLSETQKEIYKTDFSQLACFPIVPIDPSNQETYIFQLKNLTCVAENLSSQDFIYTLNAIQVLQVTFFIHIDILDDTINYYLGIQSCNCCGTTASQILYSGLCKVFGNDSVVPISSYSIPFCVESIASAILIPSSTLTLTCDTSLLQPLVDALPHKKYSILILAQSLSRLEYIKMQTCVQTLYNQLNPFKAIECSRNQTCNTSSSRNQSHTHTQNDTESCSTTDNSGCSVTKTEGTAQSATYNYRLENGPTLNANPSTTCSDSNGQNASTSQTTSKSNQGTCSRTESDGATETCIDTHITNLIYLDGRVDEYLRILLFQLDRFKNTIASSLFGLSTYFLAHDCSSALTAASIYTGLVVAQPPIYPPALNFWSCSQTHFENLLQSLSYFKAPCFYKDTKNCLINAVLPVTSVELNRLVPYVPLLVCP